MLQTILGAFFYGVGRRNGKRMKVRENIKDYNWYN